MLSISPNTFSLSYEHIKIIMRLRRKRREGYYLTLELVQMLTPTMGHENSRPVCSSLSPLFLSLYKHLLLELELPLATNTTSAIKLIKGNWNMNRNRKWNGARQLFICKLLLLKRCPVRREKMSKLKKGHIPRHKMTMSRWMKSFVPFLIHPIAQKDAFKCFWV